MKHEHAKNAQELRVADVRVRTQETQHRAASVTRNVAQQPTPTPRTVPRWLQIAGVAATIIIAVVALTTLLIDVL
jgi:hypothetical protein